MKIKIKSLAGSVLFEGDFSCLADAVKAAVGSGANLSGANLYGANLYGADLTGARLSGANLYAWTQVAFSGHGECGRMLTAIQRAKDSEPELFCGCFTGSFDDLKEYIAKGDAKYRKTRTVAMKTVKALLAVRNEETR